jgi:hypothetical protein
MQSPLLALHITAGTLEMLSGSVQACIQTEINGSHDS